MIRFAVLALAIAGPAYAADGSRDVRILDADQVKTCAAVGTAKDSRASGRHPDNASQKALATAMGIAAKSGANAAVISDASSDRDRQTITLQTYRCDNGVGLNVTN